MLILLVRVVGFDFGRGVDKIAAEDAHFEAPFTDERAELLGPELVTPGMVEFTVTNDSGYDAWFAGVRFVDQELRAEALAVLDSGQDRASAPEDPTFGLVAFSTWIRPAPSRLSPYR